MTLRSLQTSPQPSRLNLAWDLVQVVLKVTGVDTRIREVDINSMETSVGEEVETEAMLIMMTHLSINISFRIQRDR